MKAFTIIASFAGGYAACVFTWAKVKEWVNGIELEYHKAKAKVDDLRARL